MTTQAETDWRSDASIAYAILRLTLGVNIGLMLIVGFQTRLALIFFVVLVCRSWNLISLDALLGSRDHSWRDRS